MEEETFGLGRGDCAGWDCIGGNYVYKWFCHVYVGLVKESYVLRCSFLLYSVDDGLEFLGVIVGAGVCG